MKKGGFGFIGRRYFWNVLFKSFWTKYFEAADFRWLVVAIF
jgi:hypothetical protein